MTEAHRPASADRRGREVALARVFAEFASGLVGDFDVQDLLHRLAEHCVDLLPVSACGVMLSDPQGRLRVVAAHPEHAESLELLQLQDGQGPCVDCLHTGEPVRSGDLTVDGSRWPDWSPAALAQGIRTVYAIPLRTLDTVIGTLNLFSRDPHSLSEADLVIIRVLADVATITVLQQRSTGQAAQLHTQLRTALESRVRIEQAKGIIAQSLTIDMDDAFQLLRHNSRNTNRKMTVLADDLITGRAITADLLPPRAA